LDCGTELVVRPTGGVRYGDGEHRREGPIEVGEGGHDAPDEAFDLGRDVVDDVRQPDQVDVAVELHELGVSDQIAARPCRLDGHVPVTRRMQDQRRARDGR
jgi:hypothetical protein